MTALRVKVFDNEQGQLDKLGPRVSSLIESMGYEILLIAQKIEPSDLVEGLLGDRPDVVFVDNHFGKDPALRSLGFEFIAKHKQGYTDSVFVLMTRQEFIVDIFGTYYPHPDIIVSKAHLASGDKTYARHLALQLQSQLRRTKVGVIHFDADCEKAFQKMKTREGRKLKKGEVESIVEQICYMGRPAPENQIDTVEVSYVGGGLSGSVVTKVELFGRDHSMGVPAIVKFSERTMAEMEVSNHTKYVRWTLPYTWRVDVIGTGRTGEFGAVAYSFAHGGESEPISLYKLMRTNEIDTVATILGEVFDPNNKTWYENVRSREDDIGTYLSVDEPYFRETRDWRKKENRLLQYLTEAATRNSELKILGEGERVMFQVGNQTIDIRAISNKLFTTNWKIPAVECICHGDMNAENIMVKRGSTEFSFIDFQATGWHHRARDFCAIEGSVRTGLPVAKLPGGFQGYFERELEWLLLEKDRSGEGKLVCDDRTLIAFVRRLFLENFDRNAFLEIVFANFIHTWWLSIKNGAWSPEQRDRLLACVLATFQYLLLEKAKVEAE